MTRWLVLWCGLAMAAAVAGTFLAFLIERPDLLRRAVSHAVPRADGGVR